MKSKKKRNSGRRAEPDETFRAEEPMQSRSSQPSWGVFMLIVTYRQQADNKDRGVNCKLEIYINWTSINWDPTRSR